MLSNKTFTTFKRPEVVKILEMLYRTNTNDCIESCHTRKFITPITETIGIGDAVIVMSCGEACYIMRDMEFEIESISANENGIYLSIDTTRSTLAKCVKAYNKRILKSIKMDPDLIDLGRYTIVAYHSFNRKW